MIFYLVSYYIIGLICLGGWELVAYEKVEDWLRNVGFKIDTYRVWERVALYILILVLGPFVMPFVVLKEVALFIKRLIGGIKDD